MTKATGGAAASILAIGLLIGLAGASYAAEPTTGIAGVATPADPAEARAATDNAAAGTGQLSDSDRAARQEDVRTPVVVTQAETPAPRAHPVVAGSQNGTWDETSLIGKIFIGFGALLTIASAARMFMA